MASDRAVCAEEGDLRLINREDVNGFATGSLQVFLNGGWGAVCNNKFSSIDADVACRQLGFVGGTDLPLVFRRSISTSETKEVIQVRAIVHCGSGGSGTSVEQPTARMRACVRHRGHLRLR